MNIRIANKFDVHQVINLIHKFQEANKLPEILTRYDSSSLFRCDGYASAAKNLGSCGEQLSQREHHRLQAKPGGIPRFVVPNRSRFRSRAR